MPIQNNLQKFNDLRKEYPVFVYDSYHYEIADNGNLVVSFSFFVGNAIRYNPIVYIKKHSLFDDFYTSGNLEKLQDFVFSIGMIELLSYWKSTCSPIIEVRCGSLDEEAVSFWKKLYFNGLGEFFYTNSIEISIDEMVTIVPQLFTSAKKHFFGLKDETIVPIGGGKDSVVTLEELRLAKPLIPLIINPRKATLETLKAAGMDGNFLEIQREIDPVLLELNAKGFLNGHTPFSAMLAFYSLLLGVLSGRKNIALSNESSANEATVAGTEINHQYSKSYEFEADFRRYVKRYLSDELNYYSFLRPLSELQIARLFSQYPQYFSVFKSCNAGSKQDIWCCNCSKCLFTFIILSPFIAPEKMREIFGENLFENPSLLYILQELCGLTAEKPFECVGTVDEVCVALAQTIKKYEKLPVLLQYFAKTELYTKYAAVDLNEQLRHFEPKHFLNELEINQLIDKINKLQR
ncbi:MAG: hypothetical protein FWH36_03225 [Lentimicrobiaceae bacterium]|nr:hypothetical protein [Lentimicrobiaceae bacterium]